jgi:hypothetical protein
MHSPTKTFLMGAIAAPLALTLTLTLTTYPAFAESTDHSPTPAASSNQTTPETTTPISSTPAPSIAPLQVNQQSLISNWSGSALTPPNCNGGCIYAVTRLAPATYGSGTNVEAIIGFTVPIGSNDGGIGEVNRLNAETQKRRSEHDMKIVLSEKLADAIESGKMDRAKIIAMNLAPLLGYKDYQLLLDTFSTPRASLSTPSASNQNQLLGLNPISVSIMF